MSTADTTHRHQASTQLDVRMPLQLSDPDRPRGTCARPTIALDRLVVERTVRGPRRALAATTMRPLPPLLGAVACASAGCAAEQSVLNPAGPAAGSIAHLSWLLFGGGAALLALVVAATVLAVRAAPGVRAWLGRERTVVLGGVVLPVVVLTALLFHGLRLTTARGEPHGPPSVVIAVSGERWWWRVQYLDERERPEFETANEIHVPVGEVVDLRLTSADVIHSFWVPQLGGKMDMIPGRENRLRIVADRPGVFRGQCAEFCGGAHARMALHVVAVAPDAFAAWRTASARPAAEPPDEALRHGRELFLTAGCVLCHTVRGTSARGSVGPDLTHVGARHFLAAGTLRNDVGAMAAWIASSQHLKPGNEMPSYTAFEGRDLRLLASYLVSLR